MDLRGARDPVRPSCHGPGGTGQKKCARNVCSGRIVFSRDREACQADIDFTRADSRDTLREPVFL